MFNNSTNSNVFINGNTGSIVTAPINLATGESIIAETNTGEFITNTYHMSISLILLYIFMHGSVSHQLTLVLNGCWVSLTLVVIIFLHIL